MTATTIRSKTDTTGRALRQLALLWAGAALAASAWAAGIHEEGYMLEAPDWRSEVAGVPSPDWPVDGWYRLAPAGKSVEVRAVTPSDMERGEADDATYVRVPGARLVEGRRPLYRFSNVILRPRAGHQYELMLGKTRFSFIVDGDEQGTHYAITYGGETYTYVLGQPAAANRIHTVADLDGDAMPDFLVEVGAERFLLLSTQAQPGANVPSAQLWAMGEGC